MKLVRGIHNLQSPQVRGLFAGHAQPGVILSVGAFDGLHLGHQTVLRHVTDIAQQRQLASAVLTLEPLPREYFAPLEAPARLMNFREKYRGLSALGLDYWIVIRFNEAIRHTSATQFVEQVFVDALSSKHIVVGDDFRFGKNGAGNFALLQELGGLHGFSVEAIDTLSREGERVSSSRVRQLLTSGEFQSAEKLLGRPYSISGKVVRGKQLGRQLGVPTANIELHRLRVAMSGVYAAEAKLSGEAHWRPAIANVGTRPTVENNIKAILEVHLLDFDRDIYGNRMDVRFIQKLRDEKKFASVNQLQAQIEKDIELTRHSFVIK